MADVTTLTNENFEGEVLRSDRPVLVDFWAEWCHPCHLVAPEVEALAAEQSGVLRVAKLNVDESPEIAERYAVFSIPTLLLFVAGEEKARLVGARPKAAIFSGIKPHLDGVTA